MSQRQRWTVSSEMVKLLNRTDDDHICFCHMVPTRVIRVTASKTFQSFRVEQLVRTNTDNDNPTGTWKLLSLHSSDTPGMKLQDAMLDAAARQNKFISQLNERMEQRFPTSKGLVRP
jgi:hypothetical protein